MKHVAEDLEPIPDDAQTLPEGIKPRGLARETEIQTAAEIEAWARHARMLNGFGDAAVEIQQLYSVPPPWKSR